MARKKVRKRAAQDMELNITSMMDMFTIILVFLLKSYSTDAETKIDQSPSIQLPTTVASMILEENAPSVIITKHAILVNGSKTVAAVKNWHVEGLDPAQPYLIPGLLKALSKIAERQKFIAAHNPGMEFKGLIVVQADRHMPADLLTKVMYTVGQAEYAKIKLAAISKNE